MYDLFGVSILYNSYILYFYLCFYKCADKFYLDIY